MAAESTSKWPEHVDIPGLTIRLDAITKDDELKLLDLVHGFPEDTFKQNPVANLNVYEFGWNYFAVRSKPSSLSIQEKLKPVPLWALNLFDAQKEAGFCPSNVSDSAVAVVDHAMFNVYAPGVGLAQHLDHPTFWGDWVMGFTLGSGATMLFENSTYNPKGINGSFYSKATKSFPVYLPARSAYIMEKEVRYEWTHGITAATEDIVDGVTVKRTERIACTLRPIATNILTPLLRKQTQK